MLDPITLNKIQQAILVGPSGAWIKTKLISMPPVSTWATRNIPFPGIPGMQFQNPRLEAGENGWD